MSAAEPHLSRRGLLVGAGAAAVGTTSTPAVGIAAGQSAPTPTALSVEEIEDQVGGGATVSTTTSAKRA